MSLLPGPSSARTHVRRAGHNDRRMLEAFLSRDPTGCSLLHGWLHECGVVPMWPSQPFEFLLAVHADGEVERVGAVALLAGLSLCALSGGAPADARELGRVCLRTATALRSITGPQELVRAFSRAIPSAVRSHALPQQLWELHSRDLRYVSEPLLVRAGEDDVDEVRDAAVRMFTEELGPLVRDADCATVARGAAARVRAGRTWIVRCVATHRLLFKASVASWSDQVAHVEGVWVDPIARGQGLARRALSEMCREVFYETARVCLHVHRENAPALQLYRRVGFRPIRAWETRLLD